jgi:hypothetical protein
MTQSMISVVRSYTDWTPHKPVCVDLDGTLSPYHPLWHGPGRLATTVAYCVHAFVSSLWRVTQPVHWPVWYESMALNALSSGHADMVGTGSTRVPGSGDTGCMMCADERCGVYPTKTELGSAHGHHMCHAGMSGTGSDIGCAKRSMWAGFKWALSMYGPMHGADMRYRKGLVDMLTHWHRSGVPVYLVTGSPWRVAYGVYMQHDFFDGFLSSPCALHLVGRAKARALVHRWGKYGFHYIGDSWTDRHVWRECDDIVTVAPPSSRLVDRLCQYKEPNQRVYCIDG